MTDSEPNIKDIKWRTYKGLAGDLQSLLIAEYNDIEFGELFTDDTIFNYSFKLARRKLIKAIKLLHSKHYIEK